EIIALKSQVADVIMNDEIIAYALEIVDKTRGLEELEYGLSPRAGLDLLMASKACAFIEGRDFVIPEDVISMAKVALPHRLVLTSKSRIDGETGIKVITRVIEKVKRPR
ncbi:MAG: magnesium chelatase, partial [Lachnospiraceae bacterium]|nr:magnesium chelatase [Lachnospiraceae bacterium]